MQSANYVKKVKLKLRMASAPSMIMRGNIFSPIIVTSRQPRFNDYDYHEVELD